MKAKLLILCMAVSLALGAAAVAGDKTADEAAAKAAEDAGWKKDPAYGKTLKIGYNGGLCL